MKSINFVHDVFEGINVSASSCSCTTYDDHGTQWVVDIYMEVVPD